MPDLSTQAVKGMLIAHAGSLGWTREEVYHAFEVWMDGCTAHRNTLSDPPIGSSTNGAGQP